MATPTTTRPGSIASRLRSFGVVHAALRVQSGEGVSELDRRKARALAGGRRPASDSAFEGSGGAGYLEAFAHLSAELSAAKAKMVSANSIHLGRLAEVVGLQQRRDDLKGALYSRFVKVRRLFETLYGSGRGFPVLAVSGRTPRHATGLVAQVRETAGFLAKPRVELPRLDVAGITVDPPATAAQLAAEADELDGALVDLDEALKLAEITRQAKNDAIAAYDDTFLRVARLAESLFHFAGLHELAKRLRPSTRRPGRRLADEGPEPDSGDTVAPPPAAAETTGEPEAGAPVVEIETFVARAADRRHRDSGRDLLVGALAAFETEPIACSSRGDALARFREAETRQAEREELEDAEARLGKASSASNL